MQGLLKVEEAASRPGFDKDNVVVVHNADALADRLEAYRIQAGRGTEKRSGLR